MRRPDRPRLRDDVRERLAKLLGMVGSNSDAEALIAARLADRLVRDLSVTWFDVVATPALPPPEPAREPHRQTDVLEHFHSGCPYPQCVM